MWGSHNRLADIGKATCAPRPLTGKSTSKGTHGNFGEVSDSELSLHSSFFPFPSPFALFLYSPLLLPSSSPLLPQKGLQYVANTVGEEHPMCSLQESTITLLFLDKLCSCHLSSSEFKFYPFEIFAIGKFKAGSKYCGCPGYVRTNKLL